MFTRSRRQVQAAGPVRVCSAIIRTSTYIDVSLTGWASITKGGVQIETQTLSNRPRPKRLRNKLGPAWVWGHEDRSNVETQIPNQIKIESIEPRPTL